MLLQKIGCYNKVVTATEKNTKVPKILTSEGTKNLLGKTGLPGNSFKTKLWTYRSRDVKISENITIYYHSNRHGTKF